MENLSNRQKKLHWHAWHRGMRELDILMGTMVDKNLENMNEEQMDMLEHFLEADDSKVWHWITEKNPIEAEYDNIIWQWLKVERGDIS